MVKIFEVYKKCLINRNNPTPSKEQDIAINVTAVDGSYNFVLAIENYQQCCEEFGVMLGVPRDIVEEQGKKEEYETYVRSIKLFKYIKTEKSLCEREFTDNFLSIISAIVETDDGDFLAQVYNHQNGYYSHIVEVTENGDVVYKKSI